MVIGNGAYTNFGSLQNAKNDANDMADALQGLGFTVDKILDANLNQMETAAIRLRDRLTGAGNNAYGFFYYAGHGVQVDGVNYLIPANANIPDKDFLRERAVSAQALLDMLNRSKNALNVIVLDACRDFPAAWSRTTDRGLAVMHPPSDSIIMFATAAGRTASDGKGRNGLFTSHLLRHLKTPGVEVNEVFRRTMSDVARASNNEQRPAMYTDFFETAYLGMKPASRDQGSGIGDQGREKQAVVQTSQPAAGQTYKIGDKGPGGGIIFYISAEGFTVEGYTGTTGSFASYKAHYLEVAPQNSGTAQDSRTLVNGVTTFTLMSSADAGKIGNGRKDTLTITAHLASKGETGRAAQIAASASFGGKNDWFLPSSGELNLLYAQRNLTGIGITSGWLWSSTQTVNGVAWGHDFSHDGILGYFTTSDTLPVRAVRAF